MNPKEEDPVHHVIRSAGLRFLYARYAKAKGWNDHPMAVRQRVELFLEVGSGPVGEAVAHYQICRRRWATRLARGAVAAGVVMITTYTAYHAAPAAAEVSQQTATQPAKPAGKSDATTQRGKMPRSGLEPETR